MFRPASRALLRAPGVAARGPASRRLISNNAPPAETKSRSWKNTAVRFGLAAGAVYYYNTSSVFAEQPTFSLRSQPKPTPAATTQTLDSVKPKSRDAAAAPESQSQPPADSETLTSAQDLEEEAGQEAAFNPETGEINWDCPCLGGMAHGPCGEDFKAAFSCFVYSEEEPKGMDCIEKFKAMQDCFRQYPEHYGAELEDDEPQGEPQGEGHVASAAELDASSHPDEKHARAKETATEVKVAAAKEGELPESDELMPKAWHDTEAKNESTKAEK